MQILFSFTKYHIVQLNIKTSLFLIILKKPPLRELNGGFRSKKVKKNIIILIEFVNACLHIPWHLGVERSPS